ncbi:MAG: PQQ-binding-like beta-propeller repeat protein [Planctomycetota bacterium]
MRNLRYRTNTALQLFCLLLTLAGQEVCRARAEEWRDFRGPRGDGITTAAKLPTTWNLLRNIAWQTETPGRGWSTPIVVQGKIWLTAEESQAVDVAERKKRVAASKYQEQQFQTHAAVTLYALEISAQTGELLRRIELFTAMDPAPIHAANSYASPTPVTDGENLYCHFGSLGTLALEMSSGKILWRKRFEVDDITGPGSSPVLYQNLLIFPCDGTDQQYVVALDCRTGREVWRTMRPRITLPEEKHRRAFSTPLLLRSAQQQQVVIPGAQWVVAYEPRTGRELWRLNFGDGHAIVPRPVEHRGLVYICTGYMKPRLLAIKVDGQGDVTESHVAWTYEKQIPEISSPIVVGESLFFVAGQGVATCLDAVSGKLHWQHRLGGNYSASPVANQERIYFTSEAGTTTVVAAATEYRELAKNQLTGIMMASPAVLDDRSLLLRSTDLLYCIQGR